MTFIILRARIPLLFESKIKMDYRDAGFLSLAYWGSNVVGVLFLIVAYRWPRVARGMFAILFGYAAWVNFTLSNSTPTVYLDYAEHAISVSSDFLKGWFSNHITVFVSFIAAGQLLIAVGMLLRRSFVTLSSIGVILFLVAIAPLGYYAAFPFSFTVSWAAFMIIKRDTKEYLWVNKPHAAMRHVEKKTVGDAG